MGLHKGVDNMHRLKIISWCLVLRSSNNCRTVMHTNICGMMNVHVLVSRNLYDGIVQDIIYIYLLAVIHGMLWLPDEQIKSN